MAQSNGDGRAARLEAALRANLQRRKAQARARRDAPGDAAGEGFAGEGCAGEGCAAPVDEPGRAGGDGVDPAVKERRDDPDAPQ